tara:strand:+ start:1343 stop:1588 length:246 start_codon:yes stop_codon:yes gene_type:complete
MTFTTKQKLEIANSMQEFFPTTFQSAYINMFNQVVIRMTNHEDLYNVMEKLEEFGFSCIENKLNHKYFCCKEWYIGFSFKF